MPEKRHIVSVYIDELQDYLALPTSFSDALAQARGLGVAYTVKSKHPFANLIICGECGEFYGRKVWHNHNNTKRYDVWYCNRKYERERVCDTPFLKDEDIRAAFAAATKQAGYAEIYSADDCRTIIESVTVYEDNRFIFRFADGREEEITIK